MEEIVLFFQSLSYWGIVLALACEIIPAEIVLPLAGYWVFEEELSFWPAVFAGTIGGTIGSLFLYLLGRVGGRPFLMKYGKYIWINEKQLHIAEQFFRKYGISVVFMAKFIPGIRTLAPIPCGIAKMNVCFFLFYTYVAMIPISIFYVWIGLHFGLNYEKVILLVEQFYLETIFIMIVLISVFLGFKQIVKNNTMAN